MTTHKTADEFVIICRETWSALWHGKEYNAQKAALRVSGLGLNDNFWVLGPMFAEDKERILNRLETVAAICDAITQSRVLLDPRLDSAFWPDPIASTGHSIEEHVRLILCEIDQAVPKMLSAGDKNRLGMLISLGKRLKYLLSMFNR